MGTGIGGRRVRGGGARRRDVACRERERKEGTKEAYVRGDLERVIL